MLPDHVRGAACISRTLQVYGDGLLSVSGSEEKRCSEASIDVSPSYGLSDSEFETMFRESIEYAEDDMASRSLREQQVEADRVLEALDSALAVDADQLLSGQEKSQIMAARQALVDIKSDADKEKIKQAIKQLEHKCENYVARRMNSNIKIAMQGHSIDEYASGSNSEAETEES